MAKESIRLPDPGMGEAINTYHARRRDVVGRGLISSGLKAAAVGAFAAGAVLTSAIAIPVTLTVGWAAAAGAVAYGGLKLGEGLINRARTSAA